MIRVAFLSGSQSGLKENVGEYLIHWKLVVLFLESRSWLKRQGRHPSLLVTPMLLYNICAMT